MCVGAPQEEEVTCTPPPRSSSSSSSSSGKHPLKSIAKALTPDVHQRKRNHARKCSICKNPACFFCEGCTNARPSKRRVVLCSPNTGRDCFERHILKAVEQEQEQDSEDDE